MVVCCASAIEMYATRVTVTGLRSCLQTYLEAYRFKENFEASFLYKIMARFKGSKSKRKDKRPRGGGFGFNKSKEIKEFEGLVPEYGSPNQSPIARHTMKEEGKKLHNLQLFAIMSRF